MPTLAQLEDRIIELEKQVETLKTPTFDLKNSTWRDFFDQVTGDINPEDPEYKDEIALDFLLERLAKYLYIMDTANRDRFQLRGNWLNDHERRLVELENRLSPPVTGTAED